MYSHAHSVFVKFAKDILTAIRPRSLFTLTSPVTHFPLCWVALEWPRVIWGSLKGEVGLGNIFSLGPVGYIYVIGHSHIHAIKLLLVILV